MSIWVDTDFGFDDLWALLVLQAGACAVDGVSLVAGNTPLDQVMRNALAARSTFGAHWPLFAGAAAPLVRPLETAQRVLGPQGMPSRGQVLPPVDEQPLPPAGPAIRAWLDTPQPRFEVLALGPLTNLASLAPNDLAKIDRIIWMGGSAGPGNHSPHAEFNALVDPEAAARVAASGVRLDVVDLQICRKVTFGPQDMPSNLGPLLSDLLGGYLDIALTRGRDQMAIYDPLAALAVSNPAAITFAPHLLSVDTSGTATYGKTTFSAASGGPVSLAVDVTPDAAALCLRAFGKARL